MDLGYRDANPASGDQSFVLDFEVENETLSLLVDAADGVDVHSLLDTGDRFLGVLLTHCHMDHLRTLPKNTRGGVPIFTSTGTQNALEPTLEENLDRLEYEEGYGSWSREEVIDRVVSNVTVPTGWHEVAEGIQLRLVPAGHAPGATGFLIRFRKNPDEWGHVLVTGDISYESVAGYPGLQLRQPVEIDVVFVNVAASGMQTEDEMPRALESALAGAIDGRQVAIGTSGLGGVHVAYLLDRLNSRVDSSREIPVTVIGHAAKLVDEMEYDLSTVETTPDFGQATDLCRPGEVVVCSPEVPDCGSSKRVLDVFKKNPSSLFIQLTSGVVDPITVAGENVEHYEYSRHASKEQLETFIEGLAPREVVLKHGGGKQFVNSWDFTICWATDRKQGKRTLYTEGDGWQGPPWMQSSEIDRQLANNDRKQSVFVDRGGDFASPKRRESDLDSEGVLTDAISAYLRGEATPLLEGAPFSVDLTDEGSTEGRPLARADGRGGGADTATVTSPQPEVTGAQGERERPTIAPGASLEAVTARVRDADDRTLLEVSEELDVTAGEDVLLLIDSQ